MYNNPYFYYNPNAMNYMNMNALGRNFQTPIRPRGLFKGLSAIKWGTVLNNTQKTLNVINQAIPVYYQIKPIFGNLKSFGKLMSAFNEEDTPKDKEIDINTNSIKKENSNSPTFFIN